MSYAVFHVGKVRLAIVWEAKTSWTITPEADDLTFPLIVNGKEVARFFIKEEQLVVNYRSANNGAIVVDGKVIHQMGGPEHVPAGSLIELKEGAVHITTKGELAHFLCGYTSVVDGLFQVRHQYPDINNALAVWEETAASPSYLLETGRAVYDRIVELTGCRYLDEA